MESNLSEFVLKFVDSSSKHNYQHLYIVDKQTGPYRKIQHALDQAQPHSIIRVSEGFYQQNLIITKSVKIEPKDKNPQKIGVIILVESGIGVHVNMIEPQSECELIGLKMSHSGNSDNHIKEQLMQHQHIIDIFGSDNKEIQQLDHEYVNRVSFSKLENMLIFVQKGSIKVECCLLSLNYLVKSCSTIIPAVGIQKEGTFILQNSQIKGNSSKQTIGIVNKLGVMIIDHSIISQHSEGGVLVWGVEDNPSRIFQSTFQRNSVGIHAVGEGFQMKIYSNDINNNILGIKVGLACQVEISRNNIYENDDGVEVISSFPTLYLNKIENQKLNGVICRSYKKFHCKAQIRKNISIVGNKLNGIVIQGQKNKTKIIQNYLIGFNGSSGIKVTNGASPLIMMNKIYKNFCEGILLTQNSWATVEKNFISHNIQCNIALGGMNSHHIIIIQNNITHSLGTGILAIQSGKCHISRNDITQNLDGIHLKTSQPLLRRNFISKNKNNGIICEGNCTALMSENCIQNNGSVGLFLRENFNGTLHSNIIINNQIAVGFEREQKDKIKQLNTSNTIEGQFYYPQTLKCNLI